MSKPKVATPKKILRLLTKAGFGIKRQKGSHVILKHVVTGKRIIVAMHSKDLPEGTLNDILKEAGLH